MTTVVGYAEGGSVWMAADSRTNVYDRPMNGAGRKIMRLVAGDQEVLVAISGNAGMPGVIRRAWTGELPAPPDDPGVQAWAEDVSAVLTRAMLDTAMVDMADGHMDGHFLLGAAGQIWTVHHFAAIPHVNGRAAIGSGESAAMAALGVLLDAGEVPLAAVSRAAEAAIALDMWSGLPLQVEVLEPVIQV